MTAGAALILALGCVQEAREQLRQKIDRAVARLGADEIEVREPAASELSALPVEALPDLEEKARTGDLETRARLGIIIRSLRERKAIDHVARHWKTRTYALREPSEGSWPRKWAISVEPKEVEGRSVLAVETRAWFSPEREACDGSTRVQVLKSPGLRPLAASVKYPWAELTLKEFPQSADVVPWDVVALLVATLPFESAVKREYVALDAGSSRPDFERIAINYVKETVLEDGGKRTPAHVFEVVSATYGRRTYWVSDQRVVLRIEFRGRQSLWLVDGDGE